MKERLIYVDAIKGMLILLVIIGHFGLAKSTPTILHDIIYSFHMPLFIFLSGYVIESISFQKLITRIRKLLVPFFIIGTTYSYCVGDTMTWLLKDTKFYFWYLLVLAYCLVVVYILHKISDKWRNYRSLSVMLGGGIFIILFFVLSRILTKEINDILSLGALWGYLPFFLMGHFCKISAGFKGCLENNISYTVCLLLYIPSQYLYMKTGANYYHAISAICAIVVILYFAKTIERRRICKYLVFLGQRSMDIYLYHGFILIMINFSIFSSFVVQTSNYLIEAVVSVALALIISLCCLLIGKVIRTSSILKNVVYG